MKNQVFKRLMAYLLVGTLALSSPLAASASVSDFLRAYGIKMERSEKEADENGLWTNTNTGFWTDGWTGDKTDTVQTIKEKLKELITYCKDTSKYNEKDYTKGSWRAFQSAITEAERVVNVVSNDSVSKDDVQDMQEAGDKLTDARKNLVSIKMLNEKIAEAEALFEKSDSYVETTWEALKTALEKAREIVRKKNATQEEVDSALKELESAISGLDSKEVNKTDLQALIDECDAITNKDDKEWTKATWETFKCQLSLAKRVNSNPNATQQEVDDAIDALQEAKLALEKSGSETVDKADLKALIDECKKLTNEGYKNFTKATWDVFAAALEKAEDVYADDKATSSEVETAYNNLRDAYLALEKSGSEAVDKADLKALIDECKKLTNEGYKNFTKATWDVFAAALEKAEDVYADDKATSAEVETAYNDLRTAKEDLEVAADKTDLQALIDECAAITNTDDKEWTKATWDAFQNQLALARRVNSNYNATQQDVNDAIDALQKAKLALEKSGPEEVDKADLKALIDECKKLTNEGYKNFTKATWDVFAAALEKAEDVYADDKATSSEVETAYNNLRDARLALEKSGSEAVDKAALKELIDKCKKLTNEGYKNYTKASWDVFTAALKKAETVYGNDKATSTEVENAYIGLKNAYSALEETGFKTGTVPIDPDITEHEASIFGITLDKDTLSLDYNAKDGLKARVLFDNYNADKENMDWAIDSEVRSKIEGSIKWYTADNSVAMVTGKGTDATVTGAGDGKTEVMAWIEADGKTVSGKTNTVPTEGDYIAKAVVTVKEHAKSLRFDVDAVKYVAGNEYELRDYTYLVLDSGKERPATESQVGITYSFAEKLPRGVKATITDSGLLKITKGKAGDVIVLNAIAENGAKTDKPIQITLSEQVKVTNFTINANDMDMGKDTTIVERDGKQYVSQIASLDNIQPTGYTDNTFVWSVNNKKIVDIEPIKKDGINGKEAREARIIAKGVGKAKITVKAGSGKKITKAIEIKATADKLEIVGNDPTYTGRPVTLEGQLTGTNGLVVPVTAQTKLTWSLTDKQNDKLYAKINNKGVVTPQNILYVNKGNGKPDKTQIVKEKYVDVSITVKSKDGKTDTKALRINQSDVKYVDITKGNYTEVEGISLGLTDLKKNNQKATIDNTFVGQTYWFKASLTGEEKEDFSESVAWTVAGKGIDASVNGAKVDAKITGTSNATIKASYIILEPKGKNIIAKKITKVITIKKPVQNAEKITLNKNEFVVFETGREQKVTINVKATTPKKATYKISDWKIKYHKAGAADDADDGASINKKISGKTNNKIQITVPADAKAGSVIKVGAYTDGGVVAYAYIYVTEKTQKVETVPNKTHKLAVGGSVKIETTVTGANTTVSKDDVNKPVWNVESTNAYTVEPVTYTVDKKGASVIKLDENGNVTALKPGKATVTVKTLSGKKKATVKITVE